jgi:hypothetical protein
MRARRDEPERYPWWQLLLLGLASLLETVVVRPLRNLWMSDDPLDRFGLVHLGSAAGDAMVAVALAGTIFFDVPVGEARAKTALYLALTLAPLAVAGPLLVPLLDRAGPRRAISLGSSAGRAIVCVLAAPRFNTLLLYPFAFVVLVLSRIQAITKNGLVAAYAGPEEGLVRANARLGRIAVGGAALAALPAAALFKAAGAPAALYGAAAVYAMASFLNLRLPHPRVRGRQGQTVGKLGSIPRLNAPAIGACGLRAASGFLLFSIAFALRRSGEPGYWFAVLAGAAALGSFVGDVVAPRLPATFREDAVVIACVVAAGIGAFLAFVAFSLPVLMAFALVAGASSELGRLAFQSLMQQLAPGGAYGRVFVRYEVLFQLSWVLGALIPAMLPIGFRDGFLILFGFYVVVAVGYLTPDLLARRRAAEPPT